VRQDLEQCYEWLGRHAHQFRSIQKRLLTRFKDKTPVGLAHLDTLLDGTYMQVRPHPLHFHLSVCVCVFVAECPDRQEWGGGVRVEGCHQSPRLCHLADHHATQVSHTHPWKYPQFTGCTLQLTHYTPQFTDCTPQSTDCTPQSTGCTPQSTGCTPQCPQFSYPTTPPHSLLTTPLIHCWPHPLRLAVNLGNEDFAILTATFCPHISMDTTDQVGVARIIIHVCIIVVMVTRGGKSKSTWVWSIFSRRPCPSQQRNRQVPRPFLLAPPLTVTNWRSTLPCYVTEYSRATGRLGRG